ncbi:MAG: GNAT family N-acetyltransferase [Anaerolineales bacterium]
MDIRFVEYGSAEWREARALRYAAFYRESGLPESVMDDGQEVKGSHLVAVHSGAVVGYGRLNDLGDGQFYISQMVVAPHHRGKGIGSKLLGCLIINAKKAGAELVLLSARLPAASLYERAGFHQEGEVLTSEKTGVSHIRMKLAVKGESNIKGRYC